MLGQVAGHVGAHVGVGRRPVDARLILVGGNLHEGRLFHAGQENGRLAHAQLAQVVALRLVHDERPADGLAVFSIAQLVGDLQVGVAHGVGQQLLRTLVGDEDTLAIGAHLGQQVGEGLDGLPLGVGRHLRRPGGLHVAHHVVGFLDDGDVLQAGGGVQLAVFTQQHQQEHHRQRLVVGAQVIQFQDDGAVHQRVQRVGALGVEHAPLAVQQQPADAPADGGADVLVRLAGVAAPFGDAHSGAEEVAHGREEGVLLAATVGEAPAFVAIDLVETFLNDGGQDAKLGQGGVEARLQAAQMRLQPDAGHEFERVQPEGSGRLIAQREDEQRLEAGLAQQAAVLLLGRLDDQEGQPVAPPQLVEQVEDGVGLAGAGEAGDEAVAGERLELDGDRAAAPQRAEVQLVGRRPVLARANFEIGRRLAHGDARHAAAHADGEAEGRRRALRAGQIGQTLLARRGPAGGPGAVGQRGEGAAGGGGLGFRARDDDLGLAGQPAVVGLARPARRPNACQVGRGADGRADAAGHRPDGVGVWPGHLDDQQERLVERFAIGVVEAADQFRAGVAQPPGGRVRHGAPLQVGYRLGQVGGLEQGRALAGRQFGRLQVDADGRRMGLAQQALEWLQERPGRRPVGVDDVGFFLDRQQRHNVLLLPDLDHGGRTVEGEEGVA